ncbi:Crp/Fnr family transcriptional regulator [Flavobacterium cyanobacteriorum]|uniref:Crp/Fnr family transcriptional regulator n=1 Tax=Flavobacterium cyanobacteriorum TaxID=2022802 RepID=A0A255ZYM4_9FLAO|nr:Crp/Fnr family transcriptional regulator [Flavobacterium cyanobacteriorum]OYQ46491.1 Crp/Fnr family transcriptional regulator [Flavobacterium cyanobacteriorum]
MTGYHHLKEHILKRIIFSQDELDEFLSYFTVKEVKKKQFLIQPDFVARHRSYVVKGAFRAFIVSADGQEHTIHLAIEDWWVSDMNSYYFQQPARMFVVALEDSTILQLNFEDEQLLKKKNHNYESYFRILAESTSAFLQRRIMTGLTMTAEERFNEFEQKYPLISQRVPQYVLASFLGMTTVYLSRLRNRRAAK